MGPHPGRSRRHQRRQAHSDRLETDLGSADEDGVRQDEEMRVRDRHRGVLHREGLPGVSHRQSLDREIRREVRITVENGYCD